MLEYFLVVKNIILFLKKIVLKEEGDLLIFVLRYILLIIEEGKFKVICEVCKKDVLVGDIKYSRV